MMPDVAFVLSRRLLGVTGCLLARSTLEWTIR